MVEISVLGIVGAVTLLSAANIETTKTSEIQNNGPQAVFGQWFTPNHDSIIDIYDCGNQTPCGRVAWIEPDPKGDMGAKDVHNQDESLRERPILGMILLEGFEKSDAGWQNGSIYNPENGKTYRSHLKVLEQGQLQVKGCIGPICKGLKWDPVPQKMSATLKKNGPSHEDHVERLAENRGSPQP
ncbi:MAG: DUF2147 domain-containing protein [Pseudomonadota bacterium]